MNPQMSTIQKFDLLLVMKDYSIEYSGETDANSPDLTISFSVVGENPDDAIPTFERISYNPPNEVGNKNKMDKLGFGADYWKDLGKKLGSAAVEILT